MMPQDDKYGGWPRSGEIDVMEARGQEPTKVLGTLHFGYHALHAGTMGGADRALNLISLIGGALLPPALAATHRVRRP